MSLLTWQRCCFKYLKEAPKIQLQTLASVRKRFRLTKVELGRVKSFKTLLGTYTMGESVYKSRIATVSLQEVSLVCGLQPYALAQPQSARPERYRKFNFMDSCALLCYDKSTGDIEHRKSYTGCQLALRRRHYQQQRWKMGIRDSRQSVCAKWLFETFSVV